MKISMSQFPASTASEKETTASFAISDKENELENDLADARAHRNLSRAFSTPEELFEELGIDAKSISKPI